MINYTTPTESFLIEGYDLSSQDVYVTFEQGSRELTKSGSDLTITTETVEGVTNTYISVLLTQEETAMFKPKDSVSVMVNWISEQGVRGATKQARIPVFENLLDRVITYGD